MRQGCQESARIEKPELEWKEQCSLMAATETDNSCRQKVKNKSRHPPCPPIHLVHQALSCLGRHETKKPGIWIANYCHFHISELTNEGYVVVNSVQKRRGRGRGKGRGGRGMVGEGGRWGTDETYTWSNGGGKQRRQSEPKCEPGDKCGWVTRFLVPLYELRETPLAKWVDYNRCLTFSFPSAPAVRTCWFSASMATPRTQPSWAAEGTEHSKINTNSLPGKNTSALTPCSWSRAHPPILSNRGSRGMHTCIRLVNHKTANSRHPYHTFANSWLVRPNKSQSESSIGHFVC